MDLDPRDLEHVKLNDNDVRKIVLSYLVHNCFKETAETFISCTGMQLTADYSVDIDKRKPIYKHVLEGNVLEAIRLTNQLAADLLQTNKDVYFDLLTLHFVELVRSKDCTGALEFARKELDQFGKQERYLERLQDCMALLAYEDPETSPLFSLLSMDHRQSIADALNCAVLVHANLPSHTSMERLIQHMTVVQQRLHQEKGKMKKLLAGVECAEFTYCYTRRCIPTLKIKAYGVEIRPMRSSNTMLLSDLNDFNDGIWQMQ